jgi:uncharacterized protein YigA (DUF484 family)
MGRERAVTRWEIHATLLRDRIEKLETQLAGLEHRTGERERERERAERLTRELTQLRAQVAGLGPSPRAKMG